MEVLNSIPPVYQRKKLIVLEKLCDAFLCPLICFRYYHLGVEKGGREFNTRGNEEEAKELVTLKRQKFEIDGVVLKHAIVYCCYPIKRLIMTCK